MVSLGTIFEYIIINCVTFLTANTVSQCQQKTFFRPYLFSIEQPGKDYMYISTVQGSVEFCVLECVRDPKCSSVLHNSRSQLCKLLRCLLTPAYIIPDTSENGLDYFVSEDECSDGWFRFEDHCYYNNLTDITWNEAENVCNHHGAYLVEINSSYENLWLDRELPNEERHRWIGATDILTEGQFLWSFSNTELNFENWRNGEPNNVNQKEHCAVIMKGGRWNDFKCYCSQAFICEKNLF
ncbi:perlucin-like protein [Saccostrea echinata]|uniref:perlucin-like protein n=1 Tax=Saccostrea echinata TaxID=191078 RepID=UPI002A8096A2|nr:perlucin-like protein [Saccostrea echinata]